MLVVLKRRRHPLEHPVAFDVHVAGGVDQDVVDRLVAQQRLEGTEVEHFVQHVAENRLPLAQRHGCARLREQAGRQGPDLGLGARSVRLGERFEIEATQQLAVDLRLDLEILRAALVLLCGGNAARGGSNGG